MTSMELSEVVNPVPAILSGVGQGESSVNQASTLYSKAQVLAREGSISGHGPVSFSPTPGVIPVHSPEDSPEIKVALKSG